MRERPDRASVSVLHLCDVLRRELRVERVGTTATARMMARLLPHLVESFPAQKPPEAVSHLVAEKIDLIPQTGPMLPDKDASQDRGRDPAVRHMDWVGRPFARRTPPDLSREDPN